MVRIQQLSERRRLAGWIASGSLAIVE